MNYWITAGCFRLFGENNFSSRLPSALAVGLTALLTALLIHQALRDEKLAALAAMIYMSGILVFGTGTTAVRDNTFTMFVIGSQGLLFLAAQEKGFNRRKQLLVLLGGIFAGAAFLTKGLPGLLLPLLTSGTYMIWKRKWREILLLLPAFIIIAALTALPWGLSIHKADSGFWIRLLTTPDLCEKLSLGAASRPWWYYLPILPLGLLPAGLLLPAALLIGKNAWKKIFSHDVFAFALGAVIVPLIFFSAMDCKLPAYILPCLPTAAILIAAGVQSYFNAGGHHRTYNWVMSAWGYFILLLGISGVVMWFMRAKIATRVWEIVPFSPTVLITGGTAAVICGILMLFSLRGNWRGRLYLFFFGAALLPLGISWCFVPTAQMPETIINHLLKIHNLNPSNTCLVTTCGYVDAVAWSTRNSQIIRLCSKENDGKLPLLDAAERQLPVAVIARSDEPLLNNLPEPDKKSAFRGVSCYTYLPEKQK